VARDNLWHALTPQMAPLGILQQAIEKSLDDDINITDEASALEHFGLSPKMIAADPSNIKVTQLGDLALAKAYLLKENL
ncbi:MAG: 2-C-methyl-D-erythritol 4-phosphate cytidylyltransferase, partial [Psychrobacter glaciei]